VSVVAKYDWWKPFFQYWANRCTAQPARDSVLTVLLVAVRIYNQEVQLDLDPELESEQTPELVLEIGAAAFPAPALPTEIWHLILGIVSTSDSRFDIGAPAAAWLRTQHTRTDEENLTRFGLCVGSEIRVNPMSDSFMASFLAMEGRWEEAFSRHCGVRGRVTEVQCHHAGRALRHELGFARVGVAVSGHSLLHFPSTTLARNYTTCYYCGNSIFGEGGADSVAGLLCIRTVSFTESSTHGPS
jgi:hypothetical protein